MRYFSALVIIIILIIPLRLFFIQFVQTAQARSDQKAENLSNSKVPGTLEEAKSMGKNFLIGLPGLLDAFGKSWRENLFVWKKISNWIKIFWRSYISPWTEKPWKEVKNYFKKIIEKKKPEIKREFQKEKQEMKEDIPRVGKSIWQRFKELIQLQQPNR
jgi:hypothetical protein